MKIRNGFVSNSSSSSFICQICGEEVSGYDMSLDDAEMCECMNGHTFCISHIPFDFNTDDFYDLFEGFEVTDDKEEPTVEDFKKVLEENKYPMLTDAEIEKILSNTCDSSELVYNFPESWCPICKFEKLTKEDAYKYLLTMKTEEEFLLEIKEKFGTYDNFVKFLKDNKK